MRKVVINICCFLMVCFVIVLGFMLIISLIVSRNRNNNPSTASVKTIAKEVSTIVGSKKGKTAPQHNCHDYEMDRAGKDIKEKMSKYINAYEKISISKINHNTGCANLAKYLPLIMSTNEKAK